MEEDATLASCVIIILFLGMSFPKMMALIVGQVFWILSSILQAIFMF